MPSFFLGKTFNNLNLDKSFNGPPAALAKESGCNFIKTIVLTFC